MISLLMNSQAIEVTLTPEIQEALEISGDDLRTFVEKAIAARSNYIKNASASSEQTGIFTAQKRIQAAINAVMKYNNDCTDPKDRIRINKESYTVTRFENIS